MSTVGSCPEIDHRITAIPVGASLLAIAPVQSIFAPTDRPLSRAGSLLQFSNRRPSPSASANHSAPTTIATPGKQPAPTRSATTQSARPEPSTQTPPTLLRDTTSGGGMPSDLLVNVHIARHLSVFQGLTSTNRRWWWSSRRRWRRTGAAAEQRDRECQRQG